MPEAQSPSTPHNSPIEEDVSIAMIAPRAVIGGVLMGLANLVPGISGGTMLLATGIYGRFIRAIADLSALRFNRNSIGMLAMVAVSAAAAIFIFADVIETAVVNHRWAMYSLFIGLTLGGVPLLWSLARPISPSFWGGALAGLAVMIALAWSQLAGGDASSARDGFSMMFFGGIAGASAMILPGVSGSYLLLLLGVYVPVLRGITAFKEALKSVLKGGAVEILMEPTLQVILPVGLGVVVGILVVSNALKIVLERYEQGTLGVLMGFLVGSVFGLWPFQRGVAPKVGEMFKGQPLTADGLAALEPHKYPTEFYAPNGQDIALAVACIACGFVITWIVAKWGSRVSPTSR